MTTQPYLPLLSPIDAAFQAFDEANPQVWEAFKRFAYEALAAGKTRYSADAICHRIRWWANVEVRSGDEWKLNDHFPSRYARRLMETDPRFANFFEVRRLRA